MWNRECWHWGGDGSLKKNDDLLGKLTIYWENNGFLGKIVFFN